MILGVGVVDVEGVVYNTPSYKAWASLINRCYNSKTLERNPTYVGCSVCSEWLIYSNFVEWYDENYVDGWQLDKDILVAGNKVYAPSTCLYVPGWLNSFVTERGRSRGDFPIGVSYDKTRRKYESKCNDPIAKKSVRLGRFDCPLEAHLSWVAYKMKLVHSIKDSLDEIDHRLYDSLIMRYTNYNV